jgi:hypothetical protein
MMQALVIAECVNRTSGARAYPGQTIEVSPEEYQRLKLAGCVRDLEQATLVPPETTSRENPRGRRARGR